MTVCLEMNHVVKKFNKKTVLHPFSLKVNRGECVVLCGGNGAGKSTLLHIIAGISAASEGTVVINDVDILQNRMKYVSLIGYMPDEFFAQETMTVTEFLSFYGSFRKVSSFRVGEVIEVIGLGEKKHEMIKHLSKGMRQRLMFGQAWLAHPSVLILDEPTNGLDPYWIDVFIQLLKEMKKNGTTIIFSTHMMDVAAEVGDKVLFMEQGKLVKSLQNDHKNQNQFMVELLQLYRKRENE